MENKKEREEILELREDMVVKEKTGKKVAIAVVIILAAFLLGLWIWWSIETAKIAKSVTETEIPKKVLELQRQVRDIQARLDKIEGQLKEIEESAVKEEAWMAILESATIKENKGIEDALIGQLTNEPFTYGFEGEVTAERVKKWAEKKAHQIGILAGYVDWKFGAEIRIKKADSVSYVLACESGKIQVKEYTKDKSGNFKSEPESVQELAKDYASSHFKGDKPGGLNQYEYLFTGE